MNKDPEYIRGFEQGIQQWKRDHSPHHYGFVAGLHYHDNPSVVDSTVAESSSEEDRLSQLEAIARDHEERITRLEIAVFGKEAVRDDTTGA